ncbi:hypothetical protein [Butyrivibrio sp. AE3009]|uniref:hypothetical protein n=1 Tax=Butyrivibrio sp. AE3009 TaxID=1280666 RepID=UPI0004244672|nr:hypothetical protein [Butyrivibrio sp. AE3009]
MKVCEISKRKISVFLSLIMVVCTLCSCRLPFFEDDRTPGEKKYPEFITIDVFDVQSNTRGIQRGWFAKIVRDKFNMQLNIIAPNQEGHGNAIFESMRASGNIGDLIFIGAEDGNLRDLVREGLILDMTDYIKDCDNLLKYEDQIRLTSANADAEGLFAIPSEISSNTEVGEADFSEPTNAPSIRWDLYRELGYPQVNTLEELLPVLSKMQQNAVKSDSGKNVYAFSLFSDWDGDIMQNAGAIASLYGYDILGFVLMDPETGEMESVADENSAYFRALDFFFEANRLGLVDPDSPYQNYDTVASKYRDGAVLYSFWPWMGQSLYNSETRLREGKGFASLKIEDASYVTWGNDPGGKQSFSMMIGKNTKDPQRMVDFANWLFSREGIECSGSPTGDFRGPEGLTWEMTDDGPRFTEFGIKAFIDMEENLEVPEEYGGGLWSQGVSALNFKPVDVQDSDENGVPYRYQLWDDYTSRSKTVIYSDWSRLYGTEKEPIAYFKENDMLTIIPGVEWGGFAYPEYLQTIEDQCRQTIVDHSWKMVFASTRADYDFLKKDMLSTLDKLGFDQVLEYNLKAAKEKQQLFDAAFKGDT